MSCRPLLSFGFRLRQPSTASFQCKGISSDDVQSCTISSVASMSSKSLLLHWRKSIHIDRPKLKTSASSEAFGHFFSQIRNEFHAFQPLLPGVLSGIFRRSGPWYFVYRTVLKDFPSAARSWTSSASHVPSISGAAVVTGGGYRTAPNRLKQGPSFHQE